MIADETLRLEDGRLLAWAEWGDPRGTPVVFLHCSPGSRLFCPDEAATAAAGVRLISVDRPGYGNSDPSDDPTLGGFASDVARLVDHLWLGPVPVVGWSGGGHYAIACAAVLRRRVSTLVLIGTPAPDDEIPWLASSLRPLARLARSDPARALLEAEEAARRYVADPERAGDAWCGRSDTAIRRRPGVEAALGAMWRAAFRAGARGIAADFVAGARPWGFAAGDIGTPTVLFYGEDDDVAGLRHAHWWRSILPRAELVTIGPAGQLAPVVAWADILASTRPDGSGRPRARR